MSERSGSKPSGFELHDRRDPDPGLAMMLDRTLPIDPAAKAALIRDQACRSRQFLLPVVRPLARAMIVVAQLVHIVSPRWPHAPRFLHRLRSFASRDSAARGR